MTTKYYARRDSATTVLRKAGIPARDYQIYIKKSGDGVELDLALLNARQESIEATKQIGNAFQGPKGVSLKQLADTPEGKANKKSWDKVSPSAKKQAKVTVSAVARDLIKSGMSNEQVWLKLKDHFKLDDSKKHYPSWYRAQMKRDGLL